MNEEGTKTVVLCPTCKGEVEGARAWGILLNRSLSIASEIVLIEEQLSRVPKKGAEAIRERLTERLDDLKGRRAAFETLLAELDGMTDGANVTIGESEAEGP